jgi:formylmethanofuran dehydrogenase subunit E
MNNIEPNLNSLRKKISSGNATEKDKKMLNELMKQVSEKILEMPTEDIFEVEEVEINLPPKARLFNSLECTECGEGVSEHRSRIKSGKIVCIPCFNKF